jgi:hypothetical protein
MNKTTFTKKAKELLNKEFRLDIEVLKSKVIAFDIYKDFGDWTIEYLIITSSSQIKRVYISELSNDRLYIKWEDMKAVQRENNFDIVYDFEI